MAMAARGIRISRAAALAARARSWPRLRQSAPRRNSVGTRPGRRGGRTSGGQSRRQWRQQRARGGQSLRERHVRGARVTVRAWRAISDARLRALFGWRRVRVRRRGGATRCAKWSEPYTYVVRHAIHVKCPGDNRPSPSRPLVYPAQQT